MLGYAGNSWSQNVIILLCRRNLRPCLELWLLFPSSPSVKEGDERTEDSPIENHYSGLESKWHGVPEKTMVLRTRENRWSQTLLEGAHWEGKKQWSQQVKSLPTVRVGQRFCFWRFWKLTGQNPEHPYQILKLDLVWEDMWTRWLSEVSHDTNSTLTAYQKKLLNYSHVIWHNTEVWFYFSFKKVMCIINRLITASSCLISLSAEDKRFFFANKQSYILKAVTLIWNPVKFAELVRKKNLYCCFGVFREKDVHGLSKSTKCQIMNYSRMKMNVELVPRNMESFVADVSVIALSAITAK